MRAFFRAKKEDLLEKINSRYVQEFLKKNGTPNKVVNDDVVEFLENKTIQKRLFPRDQFVAFMIPYGLKKSNFQYVAKQHPVLKTEKKGVSFLTNFPCNAGMRCDVEYYGKNVNDLICHVLESLKEQLMKCCEETFNIGLYFECSMDAKKVERLMSSLLGIERISGFPPEYVVVQTVWP